MAYRQELYEKAKQIIDARRNAAENNAEVQKMLVIKKIPEIGELLEKMRISALGVINVIGMGNAAAEYIEKLKTENLAAQARIRELLVANGLGEDCLEPVYECKKCNDSGFFEGKLCECHLALLNKLAADELCKNSSLRLCSFEEFSLDYYKDDAENYAIMKTNFEFCKSYAENFALNSYSLIFTGATGLGKTHLSLAIAQAAINKGYSVVYGTAQKFFTNIEREHFGRSKDPDGTTEDMLADCDLLILDDLGAEFTTSFSVAAFNNILNTRLLDSKPTIISTNLSLSEIQNKYTERAASRIIGEYTILNFVGRDVRQQKS